MAKLSTHVLDTSIGKPAALLTIKLYKRDKNSSTFIKSVVTNNDGRCESPLLEDEKLENGGYELEFDVKSYFANQGIKAAFLQDVIIRFYIENNTQNYHIPLLLSPFSYSTYRGS